MHKNILYPIPNRPYPSSQPPPSTLCLRNTWAIQNRFVFNIQPILFAHIHIFTVYSSPLSSITLSYFYFMSLLPPSCLPFTLLYSLLIFVHVFQSQALCTSNSCSFVYVRRKQVYFHFFYSTTFPIKILFSTYRIKKHICISFFSLPVDVFFPLFSFTFYGPFISACATPLKLLLGLMCT